MTEQENLILDGVLRGEPFICCHDGFAYFLGPTSHTTMTVYDALEWCNALGDDYCLPTHFIKTKMHNTVGDISRLGFWSGEVKYSERDKISGFLLKILKHRVVAVRKMKLTE